MYKESFWGSSGFEELLKHVKQGADLCKDVCSVLQERLEVESSYAKGLSKVASRLIKATTGCSGTLAEAWSLVGTEIEAEAEMHRQFSVGISEDLCRMLKNLSETQSKTRKSIEAATEKSAKTYADRHDAEIKCKRIAITTAKDREKNYSTMTGLRETGGKNADKELPKLEKKVKMLDEQLQKADKDYFENCRKAELARQEYDTAIYKASGQLQILDEERIGRMKECLNKYNDLRSAFVPRLEKSCSKLAEAQLSVNIQTDICRVIDSKGCGPRMSESGLPDFIAEDMQTQMDVNRRKQLLHVYTAMVSQETEQVIKTLEGVGKINDVYQARPSFADGTTRDEVALFQNNTESMLRWLEACRYKLALATSAVEGGMRPQSNLSQFVQQVRDKQGHVQSVLKYPCDSQAETVARPGYSARSAISTFFDDFDDNHADPIGHCEAIYHYEGQHYDELTLQPGDIIAVISKQPDGWWQGELNGKYGVFPSTYVKET